MGYMPVTPFRRMVDAALLKRHAAAEGPCPQGSVSKWDVLKDLATGRNSFGLSDRDITVLQVLLSFHPATLLEPGAGLVVFPSNSSICERLNGMPCSTMRRHLARLIDAGFLLRRDSPNGKRYARRVGSARIAFGFDLSPLLRRAAEIRQAGDAARATARQIRHLRETINLMRRDLFGLAQLLRAEQPGEALIAASHDLVETTAKALRRKLTVPDLFGLERQLQSAIDRLTAILMPAVTGQPGTNDTQNEQHQQSSNTDCYESESAMKRSAPPPRTPLRHAGPGSATAVVTVCPRIQTFTPRRIETWSDLIDATNTMAPLTGIPPTTWENAKQVMGSPEAATVLSAMLERIPEIHSPGAYLQTLTTKFAAGQFSSGPMIAALAARGGGGGGGSKSSQL